VTEQGVEAAEENLETIDGVGSTYAERLSQAGIETINDLANAQAEAVADAAAISENRATAWIEAAQSQE
jgi:predicted flap endonuclease-1-like 5' DNA nuclease